MRGGAKMSTENVMMIIIIVLIVIIVFYWLYNSTKIESFGPIDDCYGNCKNIKEGCIKDQQGRVKNIDYGKCNSDNCMKACQQKNNYDNRNRDNRNRDNPNAPSTTPSQACYNSLLDCITKSDKKSDSVSTCISNNKKNICKEIPDIRSDYAKSLEKDRSSSDSYNKIYNPCRTACKEVDNKCRGNNPDSKKIETCNDENNVCFIACEKF